MRIAYITFEYPPDSAFGGIATYTAQIATVMMQRGHDVEVFTSSSVRCGTFREGSILLHCIGESNRKDFAIAAGHVFASRHRELPFEIVEGPEFNCDARKAVELVPNIALLVKMHTPSLLAASLNVKRRTGKMLVQYKDNSRKIISALARGRFVPPFYFAPQELQDALAWDQIEAAHTRSADVVAPPCQSLADYAKLTWNVSAHAIRIAPHPFIPSPEYLKIRPRENGVTVGFVGRLETRKGIETLAAAIPKVLNLVPSAQFRFIGACSQEVETQLPYDEWLRWKLNQHLNNLEFPGKYSLQNMANAYESIDICVFPSLWENFPNVCFEAMAAGKAIVASSAGGMADMLANGEVGRLVPPGQPQLLADEIVELLQSPKERIRLGQMARKRLLEQYNEERIGTLMESLYKEAIYRRARKNGAHLAPSL